MFALSPFEMLRVKLTTTSTSVYCRASAAPYLSGLQGIQSHVAMPSDSYVTWIDASDNAQIVKLLNIFNDDATSKIVWIETMLGGTATLWHKITVPAACCAQWTEAGWQMYDTNLDNPT